MLQSMGTRGECFDNAVAESFLHSFKIEAIYGADIQTYREMEFVLFDYIERFYNKKEYISYIGYLAPDKYEEVFFINKKGLRLCQSKRGMISRDYALRIESVS